MRHLKNRNKLGVKTSHRMAMVRNLVTQLLEHKQIMTTLARAKNIRTPVDKMVVLAKKNDLGKKEYFLLLKAKSKNVYLLKNRVGDNTPMALLVKKQNEEKAVRYFY